MNCSPLSIVLWAQSPAYKPSRPKHDPRRPSNGITPVRKRILEALEDAGRPLPASELRAVSRVGKSTLHDNLQAMVAAKLIRVAGTVPAPQHGHTMAVYALADVGEDLGATR